LISSICLDCTKEPRQAGERRTGNVARSHPGTGNIRCAANYSPITIQICLGSAWPLKSNPPTKACSAFLLKGLSSCRNKCTSVQVWHSLLDRRWSWTHNFLAQVVANGRFVEALLQQRQQSTSIYSIWSVLSRISRPFPVFKFKTDKMLAHVFLQALLLGSTNTYFWDVHGR